MARNKLAGTKKGKSDSAKYYQSNPEARAKKKKYDTDYHSKPSRKRYRAKLNKANKAAGTYGNGDGKDMSHDSKGRVKKEAQSKNRARNGAGGRPRVRTVKRVGTSRPGNSSRRKKK